MLLKHYGRLKQIEEKHHAGLVSEADQESESAISKVLLDGVPDSEVLGEESAYQNKQISYNTKTQNPRWILDPLDGTTNYIHQFPIFCISLGLEVGEDLKLGVVDVPLLHETYVAVRDQGAYLNGQRIFVSQKSRLKDSLLATGFFPDDESALEEQLRIFSKLVRAARGVRRPGAAAYDMAQVARGVFDGFWEKNLKPWDVAAGQILVEEAGGLVQTYDGEPHDPYKSSVIATQKNLWPELKPFFQS